MLTTIVLASFLAATPTTKPASGPYAATRPAEYSRSLNTARITPTLTALKTAYAKPAPWSARIEQLKRERFKAKDRAAADQQIENEQSQYKPTRDRVIAARRHASEVISAMQQVTICVQSALIHLDWGDTDAARSSLEAIKKRLPVSLEEVADTMDGRHVAAAFDDVRKAQADLRKMLDAAVPRLEKEGLKIDYTPTVAAKPATATQPAKAAVIRRPR